LAGDGQTQAGHEQGGDERLGKRSRRLADREGEDGDDGEEEVLGVVDGPGVGAQRAQRVRGRQRRLEPGDRRRRGLATADARPGRPPLATDAVGDEAGQGDGGAREHVGGGGVEEGEVALGGHGDERGSGEAVAIHRRGQGEEGGEERGW